MARFDRIMNTGKRKNARAPVLSKKEYIGRKLACSQNHRLNRSEREKPRVTQIEGKFVPSVRISGR